MKAKLDNHLAPKPMRTRERPVYDKPTVLPIPPIGGFMEIDHVIGNHKRNIVGIVPMSQSVCYKKMAAGEMPRMIKDGRRSALFRVEDILNYMAKLSEQRA